MLLNDAKAGCMPGLTMKPIMKSHPIASATIALALSLSLPFNLAHAQSAATPQPASPNARETGPGQPGGRSWSGDPRVQSRTYLFSDTGENLPYAVFVSSKVTKDTKAPLIVALRGAGGNPGVFMHNPALNLADEGGYIIAAPMGYNSMGSFGMPAMRGRGGRGGPLTNAPAGAPPMPGTNQLALGPQPGTGGRRGGMPTVGGSAETDPAKVSEFSEKDVMNVLAMVRKEFNIDEHRIYLLGHSQGGAGALHIADKYSSIWAGVAGLAPGAPGFQLDSNAKFKDVPMLVMVGQSDTLIASVQRLDVQLKSLNIAHEYKEMPGLDHGGIIMGGMPDVFKFFGQHSKP
jgi:predicted esterase